MRYEEARQSGKWPIEIRLLPQFRDSPTTLYTLHTYAHPTTCFVKTRREELRASLVVPAGALVYEVLRDGILVSTGGLEVRPPEPLAPTIDHALRLAALPPSGAWQLPREHNVPDVDAWLVQFVYEEMPWTVRDVWIQDESSGNTICRLDKCGDRFAKTVYLPKGTFAYRFCVVPNQVPQMHLVTPTRLGWDDGAMVHPSQLMTWPLSIDVVDLSVPGAVPGDGLVRPITPNLSEEEPKKRCAVVASDDSTDHSDQTDACSQSMEDLSKRSETSVSIQNDAAPEWNSKRTFKSDTAVADETDSVLLPNEREECGIMRDSSFLGPRTGSGNKSCNLNQSGGISSIFVNAAMFMLGSTLTFMLGRRRFVGHAKASDGLSATDTASVRSLESRASHGRKSSIATASQQRDSIESIGNRGVRSLFRPRFGRL